MSRTSAHLAAVRGWEGAYPLPAPYWAGELPSGPTSIRVVDRAAAALPIRPAASGEQAAAALGAAPRRRRARA